MSAMARIARVVVMEVRPPVAAVLLLFAALGQTLAGATDALHPLFTTTTAIVGCWLIASAAMNDLGDEAIDRVNLRGALGRPLVSGHATRGEVAALAAVAATTGLAVAAATGGIASTAVVAAGLALSAVYSLPPFRLCARGALATAALPAGYVAVPYLVGALAIGPLDASTLLPLPGLYIAFVGRILLKDFRDVDGDALYGKRTFLLRHGADVTCRLAGACTVVGTTAVAATFPVRPTFAVALAASTACALHALVVLAGGADGTPQQVAVGAVAQAGRASCIAALAHLTMLAEGWSASGHDLVLVAIAATFAALHVDALAHRHEAVALRPW